MIVATKSPEETYQLAQNLAKKIPTGVVALVGDLGAGKTTFTTGFAKGLGIKEKILSPTFIYIRQHLIPSSEKMFYHIDLYRSESEQDLISIGLHEIVSNPDNLVLIEWAQKAKGILPKNTIWIYLTSLGENTRKISIKELH